MRRRGTESNEAEPSDSSKNGKKSTEKKVFFIFFGGDFSRESTECDEGCNESVSCCAPWNQRQRVSDLEASWSE